MRYARVVLYLVVAALLMGGCGQDKPPVSDSRMHRVSDTRAGLRLTLELPKRRFVAGTTYSATLSLTNLGDREVAFDVGRLFGFTILDERNETVWPDGTIPPLHESQLKTLRKGEAYRQELVFTVQEPGAYTMRSRLATGTARETRSGRIVAAAPPDLVTRPIAIEVVAPSEGTATGSGEDNASD